MQTMEYKNGKLNGTSTTYSWRPYYKTTEIDYKDGVKHGKMYLYDKRGNVKVEKTFEEGVEVREDGKPVHFNP